MDVVEFIRKLNEANKEADGKLSIEPNVRFIDSGSGFYYEPYEIEFNGKEIVVTFIPD